MHTRTILRKEWKQWIEDSIIDYRAATFGELNSKSSSPKGSNYLVTIKFKPDRLSGRTNGGNELKAFEALYKTACSRSVSRHYSNKKYRSLLPIAFGLLDAKNAKYSKGIGSVIDPHVHSLWSCHPQNATKFGEFLASPDAFVRLRRVYPVSSIDVTPMDDQLERVGDYMLKLEFLPRNDLGVTFSKMPYWKS